MKGILMKKHFWILSLLMFFLAVNFVRAGEWRFPVNLTYCRGIMNVYDAYKDILEDKGYSVSEEMIFPVAVSFQPFYQMENPLRIGGGVGPLLLVMISDYTYFDVPLKLDVGVTAIPGAGVSPYLRGGLVYHLAFGDFVESSTPGLFVAVGLEFLRKKKVGFGFEVAYDFSKVKIQSDKETYNYLVAASNLSAKSVKAGDLMISLFVTF
jgi:hypothetical protein